MVVMNNRQQQEKKQSPWDSVMSQILMQQGMLGNNNFLWGAILSGLLSNGWNSQKRRYEESKKAHEADPNIPLKENFYSNVNNWLGGMFGTRKPRPAEGNVPTYQSERDQVRQELFDGRSLANSAMGGNVTPQLQSQDDIAWNNIDSNIYNNAFEEERKRLGLR